MSNIIDIRDAKPNDSEPEYELVTCDECNHPLWFYSRGEDSTKLFLAACPACELLGNEER